MSGAQTQLRAPASCRCCFKCKNIISKCKQIPLLNASLIQTADFPAILFASVTHPGSLLDVLRVWRNEDLLCAFLQVPWVTARSKRDRPKVVLISLHKPRQFWLIFSIYICEVSSQFFMLSGCFYIIILRHSIQINSCSSRKVSPWLSWSLVGVFLLSRWTLLKESEANIAKEVLRASENRWKQCLQMQWPSWTFKPSHLYAFLSGTICISLQEERQFQGLLSFESVNFTAVSQVNEGK